jgi:hypothetical protein
VGGVGMRVEIRPGETREYQIVSRCNQFAVRHRLVGRWITGRWYWVRLGGIYPSTLREAEAIRDNDIQRRRCEARGWTVVG